MILTEDCDAPPPLSDRLSVQQGSLVFDCPPRLSLVSFAALCASDYVVIPLEAADWGAQGIVQVTSAVEFAVRNYNPRLKLPGYRLARRSHASRRLEKLVDSRRKVDGKRHENDPSAIFIRFGTAEATVTVTFRMTTWTDADIAAALDEARAGRKPVT